MFAKTVCIRQLDYVKGACHELFSVSLNSQNIYFGHRKPTDNGLFLLTIGTLVR